MIFLFCHKYPIFLRRERSQNRAYFRFFEHLFFSQTLSRYSTSLSVTGQWFKRSRDTAPEKNIYSASMHCTKPSARLRTMIVSFHQNVKQDFPKEAAHFPCNISIHTKQLQRTYILKQKYSITEEEKDRTPSTQYVQLPTLSPERHPQF